MEYESHARFARVVCDNAGRVVLVHIFNSLGSVSRVRSRSHIATRVAASCRDSVRAAIVTNVYVSICSSTPMLWHARAPAPAMVRTSSCQDVEGLVQVLLTHCSSPAFFTSMPAKNPGPWYIARGKLFGDLQRFQPNLSFCDKFLKTVFEQVLASSSWKLRDSAEEIDWVATQSERLKTSVKKLHDLIKSHPNTKWLAQFYAVAEIPPRRRHRHTHRQVRSPRKTGKETRTMTRMHGQGTTNIGPSMRSPINTIAPQPPCSGQTRPRSCNRPAPGVSQRSHVHTSMYIYI